MSLVAGCGSSAKKSAPATTATPTTVAATTTTRTTSQAPSALQGEAQAAATGDIPDNQVYVTFADPTAGYSIKYPEGWAQSGSGAHVAFRDKNNVVRVIIQPGAPATVLGARADLVALRQTVPSLRVGPIAAIRVAGAPAVKASYMTQSAPNPVTNKRVELIVDRYYLTRKGRRAIVDLATAVGVDNVDAYRLMIQSFRWR